MRAQLVRPDAPETVVAVLEWDGGVARVVEGADVEGVAGILRPTAVVVDDAALRRPGTSGASVLAPGSLAWFRAAVATRGAALGFAVRFVAEDVRGGWDPAAQYRRFAEQAEHLQSR